MSGFVWPRPDGSRWKGFAARKAGMVSTLVLLVLSLAGTVALAHANGGPVQNSDNGHYYEPVTGAISWQDARDAAAGSVFNGCPGHLVTITSQAENDFLVNAFPQAVTGPGNRDYYWLGGFQPAPFEVPGPDPDPAAGWEWVTGELFSYTNWTAGEPNDSSANAENVLSFFHPAGSGRWNDFPDVLSGPLLQAGYIIEYSCIFAAVDIKPGSDRNPINPGSRGVIPVAILSTAGFDATTVDPSTVAFGPDGASPEHGGHAEDVNGDGLDDLVLHFRTQGTGLSRGDTEACLTGQTFDGEHVAGCDTVSIVGR